MKRKTRRKKKKPANPDTLNWSGKPTDSKIRFRKRDLRKQTDRDAFGDSLAGDMHRAALAEDWPEYNRIKAILFATT